jgi:hypothetical protein
MELLKTLMTLSIIMAAVAFVYGLAHMAGMVSTAYRITPGGWVAGAQTLLLFAFYCWGRATTPRA